MADPIASLAGKRCLVLDDEYLIAIDIQQILEAAGAARVASLGSAAEALALLRKDPTFDFAVVDIKLANGTNGGMTVAAVLAQQGTPFIFLTGLRTDEIQADRFRGVPRIEKPYEPPLLIEAIRLALTAK